MSNTSAKFPSPLRPVTCTVCGVAFAMSREMHLAAALNGKPIYCPAGHAWTPLHPQSDPDLNIVQALIEARTELADVRLQLAEARAAGGKSPVKIDGAELRRRSQLIANRAGKKAGRAECRYCGKLFNCTKFTAHLRRRHAAQLAALDADALILDQACD
jgi:hypothetical protein